MSSNCSSFNTTICSIEFIEIKILLQNYPNKFREIKRGNGLRPQYIEQQYIAGAIGERDRGKAGDRYGYSPAQNMLKKEGKLFFKAFGSLQLRRLIFFVVFTANDFAEVLVPFAERLGSLSRHFLAVVDK